MKNKKQDSEHLPNPPAGEHIFEIKRAGIKNGAVWYVLGNEQYALLQYVDLRKGELYRNEQCALAAIIEQTIGYCRNPQQLIGLTVRVRVEVQDGFVKILAVRSNNE